MTESEKKSRISQPEDKFVAAGLRRFREHFHLTQSEAAAAFGVSMKAQQSYEYGLATPPCAKIIRVAQKFNVSTDYLLGLAETPRPVPADRVIVEAIRNCRDSIQAVLAAVDAADSADSARAAEQKILE